MNWSLSFLILGLVAGVTHLVQTRTWEILHVFAIGLGITVNTTTWIFAYLQQKVFFFCITLSTYNLVICPAMVADLFFADIALSSNPV